MSSKSNQDFILLIMNCSKYRWKAEIQKESWLKLIPSNLKYYHVLGDESLATEFKFDNELDILWVRTKDDYNSLPDKVISSFHAITETFNFKYLFKTDDDQRMVRNPSTFFNTITQIIEKKLFHYGGYVVNVKTPHVSSYHKIHRELPTNIVVKATKYCSGRFYFLSAPAIDDLILRRKQIANEYFEDYAIGYHLNAHFKTNIFNIDTNKIFQDIANNVIS